MTDLLLPVIAAPFVGSFLGVLIARLPAGLPVALARSRCETCQRVLGPFDMVPLLSYLALRGRCRTCRAPIGGQHLAIEFAALGVALWARGRQARQMARMLRPYVPAGWLSPPELAARGGLWVRADDLEIHLGVEQGFRPARKAHPGIRVADLDGLAERLAEHGVEVTWDGAFPGHRRFYASDNLGNRLEFLQRDASAAEG